MVAAVVRWPAAFLVANLALVALAAALAAGAPDRLVVAGGVEAESGADLIVIATPRATTSAVVAGEAEVVIRNGLLADPGVLEARPAAGTNKSGGSRIDVSLREGSALGQRLAAERVAAAIDPGPLEVEVRGAALAQSRTRVQVEDELGRLGLLALPLVLLVLGLAFGVRHVLAPVLAAATGSLGGIAVLRYLPDSLDLPVAGIAVAAVVGVAVGVEGSFALRRAFADASTADPRVRLADCFSVAAPRLGWAFLLAAAAAAAMLALPLPAARSAALGGIAASFLAGISALLASASVLAISPDVARGGRRFGHGRLGDRVRSGRLGEIGDEIAIRPGLSWIPALAGIAALVWLALPVLDADLVALTDDPSAAAPAERATELLGSRLRWVVALVTLAGMVAAYAAMRSGRRALAHGLTVALPAVAACGLLVLAGEDRLPIGGSLPGEAPHASTLLAVLAGVGAVSVARSAQASRAGALAGTLVAGGSFASLAGAEVDAVAQLGVGMAAGLLFDLVFVAAIIAPSLDRALAAGLPSMPGVPRPRLPARLRR